jgi:two-component system invasion response regulator UvrY
MEKITVLIIDDHRLVAETCAYTLSAMGNVEVVGTTDNKEAAIELVKKYKPDVLLLDINLKDISGYDLIVPILSHSPATKIIGFSMHSHPMYAKKMIRLGGKGYLSKNSEMPELTDAINAVMKGEKYISHEIRETITEEALGDAKTDKGISGLTERELEILKHMHKGMYSREIANSIGISVKTVEVHRHNILKKLKVKNAASAVAYFGVHAI